MSELQDAAKKKFVLQIDTTLSKGDPGEDGADGQGFDDTLPIDSSDSIHDGVESNGIAVDVLLDQLLFVTLVISGFAPTPSTTVFEKGIAIASMNLLWTLNKTPLTQVLSAPNSTPPTLTPSDRTATLPFSPSNTTNFNIDLTVTDSAGAKIGTINVTIVNKIHWGVDIIPGAFNDAFILGLSNNNLQAARATTFLTTAVALEYTWFAVASALGTPTFKSGGFTVDMQKEATISHTNASGSTENYDIWRTANAELGTLTFDIT